MVDIGTALEGRPTLVSRRLICIPCRGALGHTWIRQQLDDSTCPCQQRERRSTCSVPGCEPVASATAERSRRIIWVDRRAPWRAEGQAHARRACSLALAHTPCYLGGAPRPLVDFLQQLCHCSAICAAAADGEPTSGQPARTRRACSAQLVLRCVVHVGCALHALRHPRIRRLEWCASTRGHSRPAFRTFSSYLPPLDR